VIDGKVQLKHAPAVKKNNINKCKNVATCRDSRHFEAVTKRHMSKKQFSIQPPYVSFSLSGAHNFLPFLCHYVLLSIYNYGKLDLCRVGFILNCSMLSSLPCFLLCAVLLSLHVITFVMLPFFLLLHLFVTASQTPLLNLV